MARIELGRFREAATSLRDAHDRLGRLFDESPDSVDARYWLAVAKRGLGEVVLAQGSSAAATLLREAIEIHERAPAESLSGRDLLELAWCYPWLGRAVLQAGRPDAVPPLRVQLIKILGTIKDRSLVGATWPNQARELAGIDAFIGPILLSARKATLAEQIAAGLEQVQARQSEAGKQPDNPNLPFEVAWELIQLAGLLKQGGQLAEARSSLDRAFSLLGDPAKDDVGNLRWRQGRARAWETLADILSRSDHPAEAIDAARQAVTLSEDLARGDAAYTYDLACALTLRGRLSSSEADTTAAVAVLRRAIDAGFDSDHRFQTDPRIDGLQSRSDFPTRSAPANGK